ncbi:hypothetical protein D3C80_1896520 [compost metagenome]
MRIAASNYRLAEPLGKRIDFSLIRLQALTVNIFAVQVKGIQSLKQLVRQMVQRCSDTEGMRPDPQERSFFTPIQQGLKLDKPSLLSIRLQTTS